MKKWLSQLFSGTFKKATVVLHSSGKKEGWQNAWQFQGLDYEE